MLTVMRKMFATILICSVYISHTKLLNIHNLKHRHLNKAKTEFLNYIYTYTVI